LDRELGLIGNQLPAQTLKFNVGVSILLGKGSGVVMNRRGNCRGECR